MNKPGLSAAFAFAGAAAMVGQVLVLRELMAALRGNELALGLALGGWLFMAGAFSLAGGRVAGRLKHPANALGWAFAALSALLPLTVIAPRALLPLLGYSGSEVVPASGVVLVTAATLSFAAPLVGLMFPIAAASAGNAGGTAPARVYMLESLGGFGAGVAFTFVMAPVLSPLQTASAASLLCALGVLCTADAGARSRLVVAGAFCAVFAVILFAAATRLEFYTLNLAQHAGGRVADARWSKYGEVSIVELPGQHAVYNDGRFSYSVPDPDTAQGAAHLVMLVHRSPSRALLIGGGIEEAAEMLKHRPVLLDYVEQDPAAIEAVKPYLKGDALAALSDPRLRIHYTDGRRFVKKSLGGYDIVAVSLPEPSTASVNRYYTAEFFHEASRILAPGGVFTTGLPSSPNYIGRSRLMVNGTLYRTLKSVFPYVRVTPEDTNRFFATDEPEAVSFDPETLSRRFVERGIVASSFDSHTPGYMLMPGRVAYVENRLSGEAGLGINRDFRPVAYIYSLALWGETAGLPALERLSSWASLTHRTKYWHIVLTALAVFGLVLLTRGRPAGRAGAVIAATGFSGITLELAALLAFQSYYGFLYEMIGIFVALFMLGLFTGSRWGAAIVRSGCDPKSALVYMEAGFVICALALTQAHLLQGELLPGVFMGGLILATGTLTGAEYPAALGMAGYGRPGREHHAGLFYGLDLAGSGLGALACGLVLVPLFGIDFTALFVVVLKTATAALLVFGGGREAHAPPA